jgi:hypothetical protein
LVREACDSLCEKKLKEVKVRKGMMGATLLASALAILMPLAARAADAEFCKEYAQAAINQVSAGHAKPACAAHMQGARWSSLVRVHFVYCMSNPIDAVENLRSARDGYLRSCGAIQ